MFGQKTNLLRPYFTFLILAPLVLFAALYVSESDETKPAATQSYRAAPFDYYLLSLTWTPGFCSNARNDSLPSLCGRNSKPRFIVHGLWPQREKDWPEFCASPPPKDESVFDAQKDLLSSASAARHQWQKHGSCSGLPPDAYFAAMHETFEGVTLPQLWNDRVHISLKDLRTMVERANPQLPKNAIAIICNRQMLSEIRICFGKDLKPRSCARNVQDRCAKRGLITLR
ncbi:MAG: ribonuclease T2 [Pseudomonadota bacterium]